MTKIISLVTITHLLLSVCILCNASNLVAQENEQFDILIVGGRVLDGTGNPWFYADIGIRHGKIASLGRLQDKARADRVFDATGLTITPGFIDIHSHAFDRLRRDGRPPQDEKKRRAAPNFVTQGVTTVVTNQDGRSNIHKWISTCDSSSVEI